MLKTKNLQNVPRGTPFQITVDTIQREGIVLFARLLRENQRRREQILSLPQALPQEKGPSVGGVDALREVKGASPLRGGNNLRNESTEEARRIWAFVDKAAAAVDDAPGEQNVTS